MNNKLEEILNNAYESGDVKEIGVLGNLSLRQQQLEIEKTKLDWEQKYRLTESVLSTLKVVLNACSIVGVIYIEAKGGYITSPLGKEVLKNTMTNIFRK